MKDIIIQAIGFCGTAFLLLAFQGKRRGTILLLQIMGSLCFFTHFGLLGAFSGAAMNLLSALRATVFFFREDKKWANSIVWLPVFIGTSLALSILTWEGWISILPMIGTVSTTFAQYSKAPKMVRLLTLPNCPCWLIYNGISGSISGVITEVLIALSIIIGFLRHDVKKTEKA
ncbi:MAG: YgjV family protein [Clostridia bacterium]|nr:YgjV family protein [Clostridia bacterium]